MQNSRQTLHSAAALESTGLQRQAGTTPMANEAGPPLKETSRDTVKAIGINSLTASRSRKRLTVLPGKDLRPKRRDAQALEARRLSALPCIASGESLSEIARKLGVSRQAVHQWAQEYRRQGAEGLCRRARPGRPPKLTIEQLAQLPRLLAHDARAYGFATAVWTSQRIADLLWKRFRVRYSRDHIPYLLQRLGWSRKEQKANPPQRRNWPTNQSSTLRARLRTMQVTMGK